MGTSYVSKNEFRILFKFNVYSFKVYLNNSKVITFKLHLGILEFIIENYSQKLCKEPILDVYEFRAVLSHLDINKSKVGHDELAKLLNLIDFSKSYRRDF